MSDLSFGADAGLLIGAVAAGASLSTVLQHVRDIRTARQPELRASALPIIGVTPRDAGYTSMVIVNVGGGTATNAACILKVGDRFCANGLGSGFLRHEQKMVLKTEIRPHPVIRALVMCRDLRERVLVWNLDGDCRSYSGSKFDPERDFRRFWSDFYGEDDLDLRHREGSKVTEIG
jgi:hypothetical protein